MSATLPTAEQFLARARWREYRIAVWALLLSGCVGIAFAILPVLPLVLIIALVVAVAVWHSRSAAFYIILAATCTIDSARQVYRDSITDRIPFFTNINTIAQTSFSYNLKALPVSPFELFVVLCVACVIVRMVFERRETIRLGAAFWPIICYQGFVLFGFVNGMATGGEMNMGLQEVRSQVYFLIAYLIALNAVENRRHIHVALWVAVACIALKGVLYTFRRFVTLAGQPLPEQGVGCHEEVLFFNAFLLLLLILGLYGRWHVMQRFMWALIPLVILGNLVCNRRAGVAMLVIALLVLLLVSYRLLAERRRMLTIVAISSLLMSFVYYLAFKGEQGLLAQPANAIASAFDPNEDDTASDAYRDAENYNLIATVKASPILGWGYGKEFLNIWDITYISETYEYTNMWPHNTVLGVWLRTGTVGFFVFWVMIAAVMLHTCFAVRRPNASGETRILGTLFLCVMAMLLVMGAVDMGLTIYRTMLFTGLLLGLFCASAALDPESEAKQNI